MKTPISFYGGKQSLIKKILPLIPDHFCYVEPFLGGGAVFFAKSPSKIEVLNDIDGYLINFYKVVKTNYQELKKIFDTTLNSRKQYFEARNIFRDKNNFSDVENAWAFWILTQESYKRKFNAGWGCTKTGNKMMGIIKNKIENFTEEYCERLRMVQIECKDAIEVIKNYDTEKTFFYCDPPYFNSECGPYKNYSENDFEMLLKILSAVKGKFLLSSYPSDLLEKYKNNNSWKQIQLEKYLNMSSSQEKSKSKTEVLTANYILEPGFKSDWGV
jgi:DNA adenine methylase